MANRPWLPHAKKFARVEELPTLDIFLEQKHIHTQIIISHNGQRTRRQKEAPEPSW
jgi:hypothetical protein